MAATLTVWKFGTPDGAHRSARRLRQLNDAEAAIHDAAIIAWPTERTSPRTQVLDGSLSAREVGGAFWGLLFGLLFFVPFLRTAASDEADPTRGSLIDIGIDDDFFASVKHLVVPGTSAVFVLSSAVVFDKVHEAFKGSQAQLIRATLTAEEEHRLREAFDET